MNNPFNIGIISQMADAKRIVKQLHDDCEPGNNEPDAKLVGVINWRLTNLDYVFAAMESMFPEEFK